jgi:hypothetical protein
LITCLIYSYRLKLNRYQRILYIGKKNKRTVGVVDGQKVDPEPNDGLAHDVENELEPAWGGSRAPGDIKSGRESGPFNAHGLDRGAACKGAHLLKRAVSLLSQQYVQGIIMHI